MRNHDEKIKDMSRSVLPSTWAGAPFTRQRIHKRERARERVALAGLRGALSREVDADVSGTYRADMASLVRDRRFYDKAHPLERWAVATVAADPGLRQATRAEQVAYFARLLPSDLIGKHAVSHIASALDWADRKARAAAADREPDGGAQVAETERLVREILAAGLHGTLNANLRTAIARQGDADPRRRPMPRRLLLGHHDVRDFAREMALFPEARAVIADLRARPRDR